MKTAIIIPSRFASTRLPGKPLLEIKGKPLIKWVYEACKKVKNADQVIVATDDERIRDACISFGADVKMTSATHQSGTDRCAEVLSELDVDVVVNVQGDEPFIDPEMLHEVIQRLEDNPSVQILTLFQEVTNREEIEDPSKVKLIKTLENQILYFSRSEIPYQRHSGIASFYKHIGIYAFRSDILKAISGLRPSQLELSEGLEQLRWLENGYKIHGIEVNSATIGIDTPEDLAKAQFIADNLH